MTQLKKNSLKLFKKKANAISFILDFVLFHCKMNPGNNALYELFDTQLILFLKYISSIDLVPITSCAQCPTCRTYVPVPSNLLTNSNSTHISQSISPVVVSHQVSSEPIHVAPIPKTTARVSVAKHTPFTHEPDISYIEPYNPVQPRPPVGRNTVNCNRGLSVEFDLNFF